MSVRIAGIWELSWNTPLTESWMWSFVLREFGVTDWAMCPITGIIHNESYNNLPLVEYRTPQEMVQSYSTPTHVNVFIDENGTTPLHEFQHPENATYFFGCAGRTPMDFQTNTDVSVKIVTPDARGVLWPHQCLLLILYDRMIKSWPQK